MTSALFNFLASLVLIASILLALHFGRHGTPNTLVIYVFSDTDKEYIYNLRYFVREGIKEGDGCDYVIVIQREAADSSGGEDFKPLGVSLPPLPPNARYVHHLNECYDWGTLGWLLSSKLVDISKYLYFILINSSVRGPFISPLFLPSKTNTIHWSQILTSRIGDRRKGETRMVGSVVSCEGTPFRGNETLEKRQSPHVQSYVLATDSLGLDLLVKDGSVLSCHQDRWDAIWYGEVGSGMVILDAGYNLDSLMIRYQGVNWLDQKNRKCNGKMSPSGINTYDGINLDPYEALFVKVKAGHDRDDEPWTAVNGDYSRDFLDYSDPSSAMEQSKQYERWGVMRRMGALGSKESISSNHYQEKEMRYKLHSIFYVSGFMWWKCFDFEFYLHHNQDLLSLLPHRLTDQDLSEDLSQTEASKRAAVEKKSRKVSEKETSSEGSEDQKVDMSEDMEGEEAVPDSNENLWRHFLLHGQFEERQFHFKCLDRLESLEDQSGLPPEIEMNISGTKMIQNLTRG